MIYLQLAAGLVFLVAGGEALLRGAVTLAARFGVSPLLIGLVLVGFGTSTPELVTSLQAAWIGAPGIAIGNVVGSNIANIFLIIGLAALISPIHVSRGAFRRDGTVLLFSTALCVLVILSGFVGRPWGIALVGLLLIYIVVAYLQERAVVPVQPVPNAETALADVTRPSMALWLAGVLVVGGIAVTIVGARMLVDAAIALADQADVSETVIGLTIVAVGTSLPELVTSVMAAVRRHSDLAFGNIVGSNIYNILGILGVTALVHPIAVPPEIASIDIWVMCAATLMFVAFAVTGARVCRLEGGILLACYVAYTSWLVSIA